MANRLRIRAEVEFEVVGSPKSDEAFNRAFKRQRSCKSHIVKVIESTKIKIAPVTNVPIRKVNEQKRIIKLALDLIGNPKLSIGGDTSYILVYSEDEYRGRGLLKFKFVDSIVEVFTEGYMKTTIALSDPNSISQIANMIKINFRNIV
jgi:hypothetical protein